MKDSRHPHGSTVSSCTKKAVTPVGQMAPRDNGKSSKLWQPLSAMLAAKGLAQELACEIRNLLAVVVCGTAPTAADVAAPLRAPGLLDCTLTLRAPAAEDRAALLASALQAKAALFDPAALQARPISPATEVSAQSILQYCKLSGDAGITLHHDMAWQSLAFNGCTISKGSC